jgi:hypothetical protein
MALGPGEYDALCTEAREKLPHGSGVILVVLGYEGKSGFSAQLSGPMIAVMPKILRDIADEIERSGPF